MVKVNSTSYMKHKADRVNLVAPRLVLSIELGTVQTVDPARKFKCTTAARDLISFMPALYLICIIPLKGP